MSTSHEQSSFYEQELSPEEIVGSDFKAAAIIGRGTGSGYGVEGLTLPKGWQKVVTNGKPEAVWERLDQLFRMQCEERGLRVGVVEGDSRLGLLRRVSIQGPGGNEQISLDTERFIRRQGNYRAHGITTAASAITLHATVANYLNYLSLEMGNEEEYAYIDREPGQGYFSVGLVLPDRIMTGGDEVMPGTLQQRFTYKAHNIAGRFGQEIKHLQFDERSLLQSVTLLNENATMYYLDRDLGRHTYVPHNVDRADQAFALHGIIAAYLNATVYETAS